MDIFSQISLYNPLLVIIIVLLFLAILYVCLPFIKVFRALAKVPGPKGYPLVGNMEMMQLKPEDFFNTLKHYSEIYNPIYNLFIGYNPLLFTWFPGDIEMILSQMKHLEKGTPYIPLHGWLREGLLLSKGAKWQHRRKLLTPTFHFTILNQFTKVFTDESNKLVKTIEKISNEPVDVLSVVANFTMQSICETAMGTKLEEHEAGKDYKDTIHKTGILVIDRYVTPWQHNEFLHKFSWNYWKSKSLIRHLQKFSSNVIKLRENSFNLADMELKENSINSKKRIAMLDLLLLSKIKDNNIDDKGIQEEVDTFMFEGHDTTAASITFSLMLLANYKDIQHNICEELKSVLNGSRRDFTMDDLNEMKYLERVIKESLRMYPSVPLIARVLSEDVTTPSGYFVPKDTTIILGIYFMHHDSKYYPDPEKFDPDRFKSENMKGKHPYTYLPFSAGPRNCIGQKFAMLEMKAVIATILRNFELHPIDTPGTIRLMSDVILRTTKPILVNFIRRGDDVF